MAKNMEVDTPRKTKAAQRRSTWEWTLPQLPHGDSNHAVWQIELGVANRSSPRRVGSWPMGRPSALLAVAHAQVCVLEEVLNQKIVKRDEEFIWAGFSGAVLGRMKRTPEWMELNDILNHGKHCKERPQRAMVAQQGRQTVLHIWLRQIVACRSV
jgi:hypothetical protein